MQRLKMPFALPCEMFEGHSSWYGVSIVLQANREMIERTSRSLYDNRSKMTIDASPIILVLEWLDAREIMYQIGAEDDTYTRGDGKVFPAVRYVIALADADAVLLRLTFPDLIVGPSCSA